MSINESSHQFRHCIYAHLPHPFCHIRTYHNNKKEFSPSGRREADIKRYLDDGAIEGHKFANLRVSRTSRLCFLSLGASPAMLPKVISREMLKA